MQWLHAWRLEFSALSGSAKVVRVVKYLSLIATLVTTVADAGKILDGLPLLMPSPMAFFTEYGLLAGLLVLSVISTAADSRLSASILRQVSADSFYGIREFADIAAQLNLQELPAGGRVDRFDEHAGWTHPGTNKRLLLQVGADRSLKYRIRDQPRFAYDPGEDDPESRRNRLLRYVVATAAKSGQRVFNGSKVRMCNDIDDAWTRGIEMQRTDYLSSMMTDGVAFLHIADLHDPAVVLSDGWTYFLSSVKGTFRLRSLADTASSNQLGASTLAFTSDGFLMLVYQTAHNRHSGGKIAPSGSGSFDWEDIEAAASQDFLHVLRHAAARELVEESGLEGHREITVPIVASEYILPYAFSRIIRRAGKPEFFCLGYLPLTVAELLDYKPRRRELIYTVKSFASDIGRFDPSRDPLQELERICTHYSATDRLFSAQAIRDRYGLSYQVQHGLALLSEAIHDPESAAVILGFLRRHFSMPADATPSPQSRPAAADRSPAAPVGV